MAFVAKAASSILGSVRRGIVSRLWEAIVPLYSALVGWYLERCTQFWVAQCDKNVYIVERVQGRAMEIIMGLEHLRNEERLTVLGLFSMEQWQLRRDLTNVDRE